MSLRFFSVKFKRLPEIFILCLLCLAVWHSVTFNRDLTVAIGGFSPLHYLAQLSCPTCFIGDFPNYDQFSKSLISQIYKVLQFIGTTPYNSLLFVIACEIVTFTIVVYLGAIKVFKRTKAESLFITILVSSSTVLHINLGGWQAPIFSGLPSLMSKSSTSSDMT